MKIKDLKLLNFGPFNECVVKLAPRAENEGNVTIFVGNNGAGKTFLLKSLGILLSWFVARVGSEKSKGRTIAESDITMGALGAFLEVTAFDFGETYTWSLARSKKGRKFDRKSALNALTSLAEEYRHRLSSQPEVSLPLFAFYPVERVVLDIPLRIKGTHDFEQLDGYDSALSQGVDFRRFFEWFRRREDIENEEGIPDHMIEYVQNIFKEKKDDQAWEKLKELQASSRDKQLTAVRRAVETFMPEFSRLRVQRKPRLHMVLDKNGETFDVVQLSQGEKSLMALVGDIARRLAMMNPGLDNPLSGEGAVLIDEADLHLHPRWQRTLVANLVRTFPNCQFIMTTHSPLVISDQKGVVCYLLDDGELTELEDLFGLDVNQVLLEAMDTEIRNEAVSNDLDSFLECVQKGDKTGARKICNALEQVLPKNHIELIRARLMLKKMRVMY